MPQTIHDIMTRDVKTVNPESTIRDAAQLMNSKDFGSMPVCKGRKVVGVITDRDITIRAVAQGRDPGSTRVSEVMTEDVVSVRETSNLTEAEQLMHDRQIRRLPVLSDQGDLVGYLALAKVARTASPEQTGEVIKGISQRSKPAPMQS
jgi:CBS domain-containing protein